MNQCKKEAISKDFFCREDGIDEKETLFEILGLTTSLLTGYFY